MCYIVSFMHVALGSLEQHIGSVIWKEEKDLINQASYIKEI